MSMSRVGGLMTACTQPGCSGTIVDGYCDVCGSPSGAVPFVLIEGFPSKLKNAGLMTACTQPGCTGMIVDGYCDVCGSPASAPAFVPAGAAASAASPAPAAEPGLTAFRRVSGFFSRLRNAGLMTACTQPGCSGTIVDGYCDVCGSPAGAPPFVPGAAVSAASPALAAEPDLTAVRRGVVGAAIDVEMADTALAGPDDDDTVGMPRVVSVVSGGRHPLPQLP